MGIPILSRSSVDLPRTVAPNPDPSKYTILTCYYFGTFMLLYLSYEGCTNFEGKKILVFRNITLMDLETQGFIDPHFSDSKTVHHPIARFLPTEEGLRMAKEFCTQMMHQT
jgi:hypothetical protein